MHTTVSLDTPLLGRLGDASDETGTWFLWTSALLLYNPPCSFVGWLMFIVFNTQTDVWYWSVVVGACALSNIPFACYGKAPGIAIRGCMFL